MRSGTTEYGLRYAVKRSSSKVGYCSLGVRCGTRAEGNLPEGIAHLVEHTIFKGTLTRSAARINSYLDRLGGELNAYTTKEEIVLHSTVLKEDIWKACGLLLDIATHATFPEHEVETERGVVLDEIISYKDSPSEDIYDCFESSLFAGHPLGRLTLGTRESVSAIGPGELREYYRNCFVPSAMALCIVANEDEAVLEQKALKLCEAAFAGISGEGGFELCAPTPHIFSRTEERDNHEANAVIGALAPSLYEEKERLTAVLLANILGGPASNSLLGAELREKHGWVYGVECGYTQYSDAGLMSVSIGCDRENLGRCLRSTRRILDKMCSAPLGEARLRACKKQLLGQLAISSDSGENQCLSMGKSLLSFGRIASDAETLEAIRSISAEQLRAMAERVFGEGKTSELIFI